MPTIYIILCPLNQLTDFFDVNYITLNYLKNIELYLKEVEKGLKSKNVEEVQWWIGDLFILLCENKEIIDPVIYQSILEMKNSLYESISTSA